MKKVATTAAAVARRSCTRMSHIRAVKVESRIIIPILPLNAAPGHQYRPLGACATWRRYGLAARHQSIAAFWNHMVNSHGRVRACDVTRDALGTSFTAVKGLRNGRARRATRSICCMCVSGRTDSDLGRLLGER